MTRKLAIEMFPAQAQSGPAPMRPGVYGLWAGDTCLYIGRSQHLAWRIRQQRRGRRFRGCDAQWIACKNDMKVERWLVEALRPALNKRLAKGPSLVVATLAALAVAYGCSVGDFFKVRAASAA